MKLTTRLQLVLRSRKRASIHPLPNTPSGTTLSYKITKGVLQSICKMLLTLRKLLAEVHGSAVSIYRTQLDSDSLDNEVWFS
jgi:hypothetical protein